MMLTRRYPMPLGFELRFTLGTADNGEAKFLAEWSPRVPGRFEHRKMIDAYRAARHQFLEEVSEAIGGGVLVLEV